MSVGFGFSVGDFLAGLKLVGTVIDALRETGNSSAAFKSLIDELRALQSALRRVKQLDLDQSLNAQKTALLQAASQCQQTLHNFWTKVQKYQPHLTNGETNSRVIDSWFKIEWATCRKSDLDAFRAEVQGHTSSIEIMLLTVQMDASTMTGRQQQADQRTIAGRIQSLHTDMMVKFDGISTNGSTAAQQHTSAMANLTATIVDPNLRVFQMLQNVHAAMLALPGQVMFQQPVIFTDVFNRKRPIHLEMISSKDALLHILKDHFIEQGCDPTAIDRGEYVIEESGSLNRIDLAERLDFCLQPGQVVEMSIKLKQTDTNKGSCPRCRSDHAGSTASSVTCSTCGTVFRRVEELEVHEEYDEFPHTPALPGFASDVELRRMRKRKRDAVQDGTVFKYRRVHVISTIIKQARGRRSVGVWHHGLETMQESQQHVKGQTALHVAASLSTAEYNALRPWRRQRAMIARREHAAAKTQPKGRIGRLSLSQSQSLRAQRDLLRMRTPTKGLKIQSLLE